LSENSPEVKKIFLGYPGDQNSPTRPCPAKVAATPVKFARCQSRPSRVAYHPAPRLQTVCGDTIALIL
jgi:hypothetical protein